jgi:hypothetical protein
LLGILNCRLGGFEVFPNLALFCHASAAKREYEEHRQGAARLREDAEAAERDFTEAKGFLLGILNCRLGGFEVFPNLALFCLYKTVREGISPAATLENKPSVNRPPMTLLLLKGNTKSIVKVPLAYGKLSTRRL